MKLKIFDSLYNAWKSRKERDSVVKGQKKEASQQPYDATAAPDNEQVLSRSIAPASVAGRTGTPVQEALGAIGTHPDIMASMRALGQKYNLAEITIATDDGLVLATSAKRDVEFDAVHYSQVVQLMASPSEPDVTLFELWHKGSHLIGIIRTTRHISPVLKEQIRDDTKVILQWWL